MTSQRFEDREIVMRIALSPPPEGEIENSPGLVYGIKGLERLCEDRPLLENIERFPQWMSEGPSQENGPRGFYPLGIRSYYGDAYGGYSRLFDLPLYQSQGLIAYSSTRRKKNDIDLLPS